MSSAWGNAWGGAWARAWGWVPPGTSSIPYRSRGARLLVPAEAAKEEGFVLSVRLVGVEADELIYAVAAELRQVETAGELNVLAVEEEAKRLVITPAEPRTAPVPPHDPPIVVDEQRLVLVPSDHVSTDPR